MVGALLSPVRPLADKANLITTAVNIAMVEAVYAAYLVASGESRDDSSMVMIDFDLHRKYLLHDHNALKINAYWPPAVLDYYEFTVIQAMKQALSSLDEESFTSTPLDEV